MGIEAAARHLALPVRTVYRLAQRRAIPAVKVGRTWRFKRSILDAHLAGTDGGAAPDSAQPLLATVTALADLSVDLSGLRDASEIAHVLSTRLVTIFGVDLVGLLRREGTDLILMTASGELELPAGYRFDAAADPLTARIATSELPLAVEDLGAASGHPIVTRFGLRSALFVPIPTAEGHWGVLTLATFRPRRFDPVEVDRLVAIAGQTGLALANARLLSETRRWSGHLERIEGISRLLNRCSDVRSVALAVADEIGGVIPWDGLRFYVLGSDGRTLEPVVLRSHVPYYEGETPDLVRLELGRGLGGHIALNRRAEIIADVLRDPRMQDIPGTDDVDESMIVTPLVHDDAVLGVLELSRLGLDAFDASDLRLSEIVGAQAAVALSNARRQEELVRRSQELVRRSQDLERRLASQRQLLAITERLLATRNRDAVLAAVADTLADIVPHDTMTIYLVDRAAGCLVPVLARDEYAAQILATRPPLGSGITGSVIERGEAELVNDANDDPRVVRVPGTPDEDESMIVAPIPSASGIVGALNLYRTGRHFDPDDLELTRLFANHVAIALENAAITDQLVEAARTDPLTGLPNRRFFTERVEQAIARRNRRGGRLAVLFLDLDGFKLVNDSLGHQAGDRVLTTVAERFRSSLRLEDTVARLGGDEFGILLEDVSDVGDALAACRRLSEALAAPLDAGDRTWAVRASIGVAVDEGGAASADSLLRDADTAMYHAKGAGRGGVAVFEPAMHAAQLARLEMDSALRLAIERNELSIRLQPIVEIATGRIAAVEALLRWEHPERGVVLPGDFIEIAEENGLIVPMGRWVLREACRTLGAWRATGVAEDDVTMSVNTSVRQLADPAFPDHVEQALAEASLPADRLVLEVTESVMLSDARTPVTTLRRLRDRGVRVAVDDFGTGYSALGQLKRLPVDAIKIDRSFVDGLGSERETVAIVRAAIAFAKALDLGVTAEGIERDVQLEILSALDCRHGQGYRFSPPLPVDTMAEMLASRRRFEIPRHPTAEERVA